MSEEPTPNTTSSNNSQEVIDIDSDGSSDGDSQEFNTFEMGPNYYKPIKSNFFNRVKNTVLDDDDSVAEKKIWVQKVDWLLEENKAEHRTTEYDNRRLILRRGQEFKLKLILDKPFDSKKNWINITFYTGDRPAIGKGTLCPVSHVSEKKKLDNKEWSYQIVSVEEKVLTLRLISSASCPVGYYKLLIESYSEGEELSNPYVTSTACTEEVFLLFNCWCKEDPVYLEDEEQRKEYVLNDTGLIWVGTHRNFGPIPWNFGQYEICVLECAIYLLSHANLSVAARSDPVKLTRALSALINSQDDNGVLWGRWTETFPANSTDPTEWVGSVEILRQYLLNEEPVRFGQCWVFSGVFTTLMRCLGIPSRSVTNFESGHDTDCSFSIDCHFDAEGNPVDDLDDSVWNFHVWNEAWFKRSDLPPGYDGWQAVDATPQEASENIMRCGPCPVAAIKNGDTYIPYDTGFMFAEVNGDKIWWKVEKNGDMSVCYIDRNAVGKCISTKAVGSNDREDVTMNYKHPEGSKEESNVVTKVSQFGSRKEYNVKNVNKDVAVEIKQETTFMGEEIVIPLEVHNKNARSGRTVTISAHLKCCAYTGRTDNKLPLIKSETSVLEVSKKESDTVEIRVPPAEYMKKIKAGSVIKMYLQVRVQETKQIIAIQESFLIKKPTGIQIVCDKVKVKQYEDFTVTCTYTNSSQSKLTKSYFYLEGPGIRRSKKLYCGTVQPDSSIERKLTLSAYRIGERPLIAKFCNSKIPNATDSVVITVEAADTSTIID